MHDRAEMIFLRLGLAAGSKPRPIASRRGRPAAAASARLANTSLAPATTNAMYDAQSIARVVKMADTCV